MYQDSRIIPVVFHNLTNYDAHFIITKVASDFDGSISIIPINDQRYVSFTKTVNSSKKKHYSEYIRLRFIDSFRFMSSSLASLSLLLPPEKMKILYKEYSNSGMTNDQIELLSRKGILCYDYIDSWEKLDDQSLPSKEYFFSKLSESDISDEDYEFAQQIWRIFNVNTLGEYSDLYLKTDVLLLADVFENFRENCLQIYKLDPAHYYTSPGLSFDAMLKYTKIEIELLTDIDMFLMIEKGIRGGISQCSKRYSKANNKYMVDFDENQESKYLIYLDANNLYGYSMMQHLPLNNFSWAAANAFNVAKIMSIRHDSPIGYVLEVDMEYPKNLHDLHRDYPFCAENRIVPGTKRERKLLLTLFDKTKYVIHYRMLQFTLQNGLILKNVHRVVQFNQSPWLKPYIELNTDLRSKATNEFEKNLYKLMCNAIYGKTMENLRSRVDIRLRSKWVGRYGVSKLISLPNFKKNTIFNENLVAVELSKTNIVMNKPIAIGMSILDLSKLLMYDFHYSHMKAEYTDNIEIMYTDTDSFIYEIKADCFYTYMKNSLHQYDTSDYPPDNIFGIPLVNKKIPGLFKDELKSQIMTEFVGLRSKMYCVKAQEVENMKVKNVEKMKKAKGVKKNVLKNQISFDDFLNCIQNNCTVIRFQNSIRSKLHKVFTVRQKKVALSPFDNKRYILQNKIDTLPWGHYQIPNDQN